MRLSLKDYNTFGLDVSARELIHLVEIQQLDEIAKIENALILGGGSNVLFTQDIDGCVVINQLKGIQVEKQDDNHVLLHVASGEVWHDLVMYAVEHDYGGIENLSLIPGSVGAAPMQNIGAYGVEIKDVLTYVDAFDLNAKESKRFSNEECEFGYRESVFKRELKGQYFIEGIGIRLTTKAHNLSTHYGAIQEVIKAKHISEPTIKDISDAVIAIRKSKLPDPNELGNAGSFFKNPVITIDHFDTLKNRFPEIKSYPVDEQSVKVPAGWLIESLGWKGKRVGQTGSHEKQALVLVNYGNAQGKEIKELSSSIQASVWEQYQIKLETEVNIY